MLWDAWDIERFYRDTIVAEDRLASREVVADGPLFFTLGSRYEIGRHSTLTQDMTFYSRSRRIDFTTRVDWQETHTLLKVGFPVDVHADSCRHEIQFGHLVRPSHTNTSYDQARFETCAHKWVDVSENGYGVAILNDCKYGHDALDKMISISLLRSCVLPDEKADRGAHEFTYALLPHSGDFSVEQVVHEAYALNVPLACIPVARAKGEIDAVRFCTVSNPNVVVEAVKKAEDGDAFVIRAYEAGNSRGPVELGFAFPVASVQECNLVERQVADVPVKHNSVTFTIQPFEIKTFLVSPHRVSMSTQQQNWP